MNTIAERVAAGAALLDRELPDWWKTNGIDLSLFDMASDCRCVIGQLSPDKHYGNAVSGEWLDLTSELAVDSGFYSVWQYHASAFDEDEDGRIEREYEALTSEWRRVITERRAAA